MKGGGVLALVLLMLTQLLNPFLGYAGLDTLWLKENSISMNSSRLIPYRRVSFVYSDPSSYVDEFAFLASIPANIFRGRGHKLYMSPILYGEGLANRYLLEDWAAYSNFFGGVKLVDFIGPFPDSYVERQVEYLKHPDLRKIVAQSIYEYASRISLGEWINCSRVVIASVKEEVSTLNPIHGTYFGKLFNITDDYLFNYTSLGVVRLGGWINFTMPSSQIGWNYVMVYPLNWTERLGAVWLRAYLIDSGGRVIDYDFAFEYGDYLWSLKDVNEKREGSYTVAVYLADVENKEAFKALTLVCMLIGVDGKLGNSDVYSINVPENAEGLEVWVRWHRKWAYGYGRVLWAVDPWGNWHFPNVFEMELEYPTWMIKVPYPAAGNWTLIAQDTLIPWDRWPRSLLSLKQFKSIARGYSLRNLDKSTDYSLEHKVYLYSEDMLNSVKWAVNGAVLSSILNVPLLYVEVGSLPKETVEALRILNVEKVIVVGVISDEVRRRFLNLGIGIEVELIDMKSIIKYIRKAGNSPDLILTIPSGNFFTAAALAGAFHGAPVLFFEGEGKEVMTLADSNWGWMWFAQWFSPYGSQPNRDSPVWRTYAWKSLRREVFEANASSTLNGKPTYSWDFLAKSPHFTWMSSLADVFFEWIKKMGVDSLRSVVTVAPMDVVKTLFEVSIQGVVLAGRMPGEGGEENVAFINRAMLHRALAFVNPGRSKAMLSAVTYAYGFPVVDNNGRLLKVNSYDDVRNVFIDSGFKPIEHVGKYQVYKALTDGVAFWYFANHGDYGWIWDWYPFGQGVLGLWYDDPAAEAPIRGYEFLPKGSYTWRDWDWYVPQDIGTPKSPDAYNLILYPVSDGLVYQRWFGQFSWATGLEIDRMVGNLRSILIALMMCFVGSSKLPITFMRHGALGIIGDLRPGYVGSTDAFCIKYTEGVFAGLTLGEAFKEAVRSFGYNYYERWVNWTAKHIWNYSAIPGEYYIPLWILPYIDFLANTYVLYGDPNIAMVKPEDKMPDAIDPYEISIGGHSPGRAIRRMVLSLTLSSISLEHGEKVKVTVKVNDVFNKPITGALALVMVDNFTTLSIEVKAGVYEAVIDTGRLWVGTYAVKVYVIHEHYLPSRAEASFTIRWPTWLIASWAVGIIASAIALFIGLQIGKRRGIKAATVPKQSLK